MTGDKTLLKEV
jgi:hypothetical protein